MRMITIPTFIISSTHFARDTDTKSSYSSKGMKQAVAITVSNSAQRFS